MPTDYPSYFVGIRHALALSHPAGATAWQVLEVAILRAEPWKRQAVLDAWRAEYPTLRIKKLQRVDLREWGVALAG